MKRMLNNSLLKPLAAGLLSLALVASTQAQTVDQTFTLQPGWNAIYFEVQPANNQMSEVFANVPVKSVWTFADRENTVEFIFDADELPFNDPSWRRYFPESSPEGFLTTLFTVLVNRAYLVKLDSPTPVELTVAGVPSPRQPQWTPDSFNIRGFPVSPATPPAFGGYFASSAAHAGQGMYRLLTSGEWEAVDPADVIVAGEAYLIYAKGASDFSGPMSVLTQTGTTLNFGSSLDELSLEFHNHVADRLVVSILDLSATDLNPVTSTDANPLSVRVFDDQQGFVWTELPSLTHRFVLAGESPETRLSIRRRDMPSDTYATVLEISDSAGGRYRIPVSAAKASNSGTAAPQSAFSAAPVGGVGKQSTGRLQGTPSDSSMNHVGLWVGAATIDAVSEPHSASVTVNPDQTVERGAPADTPTPTKSTFNLRLIVHVDSSGKARLLKEVIQLWQNGATNPDGSVARPGAFVLVSDDSRISEFEGASLRDGEPFGRRISSVGFEFSGNELAGTGGFALGDVAQFIISLGREDPTNPFRHRRHPDHKEGLTITRTLSLEFDETAPAGTSDPGFGETLMTGVYRETLSGLHHAELKVRGSFRLSRVAIIGELNPTSGN